MDSGLVASRQSGMTATLLRLRGETPYGKDRRAFVALAVRRLARLFKGSRASR
jgi:hypothetical protein